MGHVRVCGARAAAPPGGTLGLTYRLMWASLFHLSTYLVNFIPFLFIGCLCACERRVKRARRCCRGHRFNEAPSLLSVLRVKFWMTSPFSEMSLNSSWTQLAAQTQVLCARARAQDYLLEPRHLRRCPLALSSLFNSSFIQVFLPLSAAPSCHLLFVSTLHALTLNTLNTPTLHSSAKSPSL